MTNTLTTMHPSHYLPERILSELRSLAPAAEAMQQLHPRQLEIIYEHNWFKMFVPIGLNGSGLTLPGILRREEALAWADGSTAWVVTLCSGAGWFAGFLDKDLSAKLFSDPKVCLAGSGAATGTAEILEGGFLSPANGNTPAVQSTRPPSRLIVFSHRMISLSSITRTNR